MKLEVLPPPGKKVLLLTAETKEESALINEFLGKEGHAEPGFISEVKGEVRISHGYGEHYILLAPVEKP
jgi:hypothetical protein